METSSLFLMCDIIGRRAAVAVQLHKLLIDRKKFVLISVV